MKTVRTFFAFVLILGCGLLVFVVFSHYDPVFKGQADWLGRFFLAAIFLAAAVQLRRSQRLNRYWLLPFAFFAALTAISLDYYLPLSQWLLPALKIAPQSPPGWAIDKLESSLLGILVVLVLNRLAGQDAAALYIRRGSLRLGLTIGIGAFLIMTAALIPVAAAFFKAENLTWARIWGWSPWILIFVLANASNEELIFRGSLLGKIEPLVGKLGANLVTTIPFVLMHAFTGYAANQAVFLALQLLPLSLAWCWLMQKSNSIWGSILFHAAMDLPIVVGIFSTL